MKRILSVLVLVSTVLSCSKDTATDTEYPEIDAAFADAFPVQCSTLQRGETFVFKARFSDNVALGSFSLDVHQNFDHHSHSTEVEECDMDPVKAPKDPFVYIQSFDIPDGLTSYEATVEIPVPEGVDSGDYHFMIRVTDRAGWQTMKGLSIKIH
ncbi:DUF4625 domain-containing protein [Parapedobacter deserti]|uniref:DUF4625 domain-containing protein n=1 Tax=Parapedobacter deserti TaxID=1912957 RepID=A0ABV7JK20_9SPHI